MAAAELPIRRVGAGKPTSTAHPATLLVGAVRGVGSVGVLAPLAPAVAEVGRGVATHLMDTVGSRLRATEIPDHAASPGGRPLASARTFKSLSP